MLLKLVFVFTFIFLAYGCTADLHKKCLQYVEVLETEDVCTDIDDEIDCSHEHGGVGHQCTRSFSEIKRICHKEKVKVRKCVRSVCDEGYHKNSKGRCVK